METLLTIFLCVIGVLMAVSLFTDKLDKYWNLIFFISGCGFTIYFMADYVINPPAHKIQAIVKIILCLLILYTIYVKRILNKKSKNK